jgi:hypothetical protein
VPLSQTEAVLELQGYKNDVTCDAAYHYLASLFCSEAVQSIQFNRVQLLMLCSGIQRLCGVRARHIWCSQMQAHLQRCDTGATTDKATVLSNSSDNSTT